MNQPSSQLMLDDQLIVVMVDVLFTDIFIHKDDFGVNKKIDHRYFTIGGAGYDRTSTIRTFRTPFSAK